jgi:hypothetical protein
LKGASLCCRRTDGRPSAHPTESGLKVILAKHIGDQKTGPYDREDFDVLVVVWRDVLCDLWHVWRIPIGEIPIDSKTQKLVTGIRVHVSQKVYREDAHGPPPNLAVEGGKTLGCCENKSHEWSVNFHSSFRMKDEWEPPVEWPAELAHKERLCVDADESEDFDEN